MLPGVTVEAASPALLEKVRTAITDGTGQYRIENLTPGAYIVTFSLAGFVTVRREGVEVSGAQVITISADLRVGGVQETITVTGETPVVDVHTSRPHAEGDRQRGRSPCCRPRAATATSSPPCPAFRPRVSTPAPIR